MQIHTVVDVVSAKVIFGGLGHHISIDFSFVRSLNAPLKKKSTTAILDKSYLFCSNLITYTETILKLPNVDLKIVNF